MTNLRKLQDAMARQDQAGIVRELFPSLEAERQHVEAELADQLFRLAPRILPVEEEHKYEGARMSLEGALIDAEQYRPDEPAEEEFTQQDHEEYSQWLDELYLAEELERAQREDDERRQDQ